MSRIGRNPIAIPTGVTVNLDGDTLRVKGKLGELTHRLPNGINAELEGNVLRFKRADDSRFQRSLHGLTRALAANMMVGVSQGYSKGMEVVGVGYRCDQKGRALMLAVGFSHRVIFIPPDGVTLKVTSQTVFSVSGIDKELVGDVAAKIRAIRPPEPYKGKGIKYAAETVRRKAGKTAGK
jgi:large subunit ribosomal protein L6